jgi:hypothetical protein
MRNIDHRVAPARRLRVHGVQEDLARLRERLRLQGVERDLLPRVDLVQQLPQRARAVARLRRQQPDRRRARVIPQDLGRALDGLADDRGQQAKARLGEEERVDELALAARGLAHERDRELLRGEPALEVRQARGGLLVDEARGRGPLAQARQRFRGVGAPVAKLREARLEDVHVWHPGQKNVDRWPWRIARIFARHRGQALPARS